jgi:hypothetical protein
VSDPQAGLNVVCDAVSRTPIRRFGDFDMPRKRSILLVCPICKKSVESSAPDFPFCSQRCRLLDLGKWADGGYRIAAPLTESEQIADASHPDNLDDPE